MTWNELIISRWLGSDVAAIVDDDGLVTGDELLRLAAGASEKFDEVGIGPGEAIPALIDETRTAIAMMVGGALSTRPLAPLGTKFPVDDLVGAVKGLGARHLFVAPERLELAERVAAAAGVEVVLIDAEFQPAEPLDGACDPEDTVVIVHTSGTTGQPKPVRQRQRPLVARIGIYHDVMKLGPGDLYCSASPFYHTAGVAMDATVLGMGAGIIPQDWFSIDNWRRAGRLGATCMLLVPTMIDLLLAEGALADANPKILQYGAMPIHPDTLRSAMEALPETRMLQIFGQTEASPICYLSHDDHIKAATERPDLLLSVGRAIPGVELTVEGPDSEGVGELTLRAPHMLQSDPDGWRRTGDRGIISDEGYVMLHGRTNDRIIRGGENIFPFEIEAALLAHPEVKEVAVVGFPDRQWGEIVKAAVVARDPDLLPETNELQAFVADRVAHFKVPSVIDYVSELPRNPSGKVLRRMLREPSEGGV
jgi:acyl-CoA synthetase (AMP-forming)/AMP-acid ligase II